EDPRGQQEQHGDEQQVFALLRSVMDDQQAQERPERAGQQHESQEEQRQEDIEEPGHGKDPAIRQENGRAQQDERPAAEGDRALVFVSEHLIGGGRRTEQESRFGSGKEAAVEDDPARKDQHDRQGQKEHVKDN